MSDLIKGLVENLVRGNPVSRVEEGSYLCGDGLYYCSNCHEPRQMRITILDEERTVEVLCRCRAAELDDVEKKEKLAKHRERVQRWRAQAVADSIWHGFSFEWDDRKDKGLSDKLRSYVNNFPEMLDKNIGLLLYGGVGTGKTYYAACIANGLVDEGRYVMMDTLPSLIAAINANYGERRDYYMGKIAQAHLLVLDDFGVERNTEYTLEQTYEIINARYRSGKPLIITTNLSLDEIKTETNPYKKRIFDRVIEMCLPILVNGGSRRLAISAEKRQAAIDLLEGRV